MSEATKLVEAGIGSEVDIDKLVGSAMPVDLLLPRFKIEAIAGADDRYPQVIDEKTGEILFYLSKLWRNAGVADQDGYAWYVDAGDSLRHWKRLAERKGRKFTLTPSELGTLTNGPYFSGWRDATAWVLEIPAIREWIGYVMGIEECQQRHVDALRYQAKLDALVQSLARNDILVERIDRRAGKGTSCYLLARSSETDAGKMEAAIRAAGHDTWLCVEGAKAIMLTEEGRWQIDFKVRRLFENIDMDELVTTSFGQTIPGYAEMERASAFKAELIRLGLPVRFFSITPVYAYPNASNTLVDPTWVVRYDAMFNNIKLGLGKSKTVDFGMQAAKNLKIELLGCSCGGHGASRWMSARIAAIAPTLQEPTLVENLDLDMERYGEVAAAREGTIGDELRLKRLVRFLKRKGFLLKGRASYTQGLYAGSAQDRSFDYFIVRYDVGKLYDKEGTLSADHNEARLQIRKLVGEFFVEDSDLTGGSCPPPGNIRVEHYTSVYRPGQAPGWAISVPTESLRIPTRSEDHYLTHDKADQGTIDPALESLDLDMGMYADIAVIGLKNRMWLRDVRAELEANGLSVRDINAMSHGANSHMRVVTHINVVGAGEYGVNPRKFTADEVIKLWYAAVKKFGSQVVHDRVMGENPTYIVADQDVDPIVYTIVGWVVCPEPDVEWDGPIRESMIDDLHIGEHERLHSIMSSIASYMLEAGVNASVVLGKARPCDPGLGWGDGMTMIELRLAGGVYPSKRMYGSVLKGLEMSGVVPVSAHDQRGVEVLGFGTTRSGMHGGKHHEDYFVVLPPADGTPMERVITIRGVQESGDSGEHFDLDSEAWFRNVVDATPGYKDMERLKAAARQIQEIGYEITGISQGPWLGSKSPSWDRKDNMLSVLVAFKRKGAGDPRNTDPGSDIDRIYDAVRPVGAIDRINFHYDTTDGQQRVIEWRWRSHDAPQDVVPIHLRFGEWNEYVDSGLIYREMDSLLLVEQFGDAEPGYSGDALAASVFHAAQDEVDPTWRNRIRLQDIADDLHKMGYRGVVAVNAGSNWKIDLGMYGTTPQTNNIEAVTAAVNEVYRKHGVTVPGGHIKQYSFRWSPIPEPGFYQVCWNWPFKGEHMRNLKADACRSSVRFMESVDMSGFDMDKFVAPAIRDDMKIATIKSALAAFGRAAQTQGTAWGSITYEPRMNNATAVIFDAFITVSPEHGRMLYQTRWDGAGADFCKKVRLAVLASGLRRFMPRNLAARYWPNVELFSNRPDQLGLMCCFKLSNLKLSDRHEIVDFGLVESIDLDVNKFVGKVLSKEFPYYDDVENFYAFVAKLRREPTLIADGTVSVSGLRTPIVSSIPGSPVYRLDITAQLVPYEQQYARQYAPDVANYFGKALRKYGLDIPHRELWPVRVDIDTHADASGRKIWHVSCHGASKSKQFPSITANLHKGWNWGLKDEALEPEDMERLVTNTLSDTDPEYDTVSRCHKLVALLKKSHWDWIQDGTLRISPGVNGSLYITVHILFVPGQEKPKQFVADCVQRALEQSGFTLRTTFGERPIYRLYPDPVPGGMVVIATVSADAQWIVHQHPQVTLDFSRVVAEAWEDKDLDKFVGKVISRTDPGIDDIARMKDFVADLKDMGWFKRALIRMDYTYPITLPAPTKRRPEAKRRQHLADIVIHATSLDRDFRWCWDSVGTVANNVSLLLVKHGFAPHIEYDRRAMWHSMTVDATNVHQNQGIHAPGWRIYCRGMNVSTNKLPDTWLNLDGITPMSYTEVNEAILEAMDINPDDLLAKADREDVYGVYRSLQTIAGRLAAQGWDGYIYAKPWKGSGSYCLFYIYGYCGGQAPNAGAWSRIVKMVSDAIAECSPEDLIMNYYQGHINGYEHTPSGYYGAKCYGKVDGVFDEELNLPVGVAVDIKTGHALKDVV